MGGAQYRAMHKDEIKVYQQKYYATHKDELNARHQKYGLAHKDQIKARNQCHYDAHKEEIHQRKREYRAEYPEKCRLQEKKSRKRFNAQLRARFLDIYGHKCSCPCGCGESFDGFLAMGHLQNDGKEDRMNGGWHGVYTRAIKHPDHTKYATLCYNCNLGAAFAGGGRCPRIALNEKSTEDV